MAEEAEEKTEEQAGDAPKKGKKLLFVIIAVVLVLVLAGGAAAFFLLRKPEQKTEEAPADAAAGNDEAQAKAEGSGEESELEDGEEALGAIVPFDTFLVNLSGGKYIRVQIQIEFETLDIPSRFYTRMVPMRDGVIALLTQQTADELGSQKGKENLKNKIKTMMNDLLRREEVKRVYFTQFVIQ
jgi:flagellar FliL protein